MKITSQLKIAVALGVSLAILAATQYLSYRTIDRLVNDANEELRAQSDILLAQELVSWVDFAEDSLKAYLLYGNDADVLQYQRARARAFEITRKLEATARDPEHRANATKLAGSVATALSSLDEARRDRDSRTSRTRPGAKRIGRSTLLPRR